MLAALSSSATRPIFRSRQVDRQDTPLAQHPVCPFNADSSPPENCAVRPTRTILDPPFSAVSHFFRIAQEFPSSKTLEKRRVRERKALREANSAARRVVVDTDRRPSFRRKATFGGKDRPIEWRMASIEEGAGEERERRDDRSVVASRTFDRLE
ncbi:hypothetical protein KM043_001489 [Ampulex compressa]|nr:hypothetical protein KM043_001489 [Ampulex compressa]